MFGVILLALAPIFFVMLVGYGAGRYGLVENHHVDGLNALVMNFSLPASLFVATATAPRAEMVQQVPLFVVLGAVMLLVEQCTAQTAARIVESVSIPVIGCGAGPACHGHVVVLQDLLGMTDHHPSFVQPVAKIGPDIQRAAQSWKTLLESGQYLAGDNHPYKLNS